MKIGGYLRFYGGIIIVFLGVFLTFGGVVQLNNGKETFGSFLSLVFFMGLLPILVGGWMIYSAKKTAAENIKENQEREVLRLAMQSGGYITIAQVTMATSLSPSEAETLLKRMQEQGILVLKVSDSGNIVYQIAGMLGKDEKLHDV